MDMADKEDDIVDLRVRGTCATLSSEQGAVLRLPPSPPRRVQHAAVRARMVFMLSGRHEVVYLAVCTT